MAKFAECQWQSLPTRALCKSSLFASCVSPVPGSSGSTDASDLGRAQYLGRGCEGGGLPPLRAGEPCPEQNRQVTHLTAWPSGLVVVLRSPPSPCLEAGFAQRWQRNGLVPSLCRQPPFPLQPGLWTRGLRCPPSSGEESGKQLA